MIKQVLDFLVVDDFYNESEAIDRAKGKYKIPMNSREWKNALKRK